jgi:RES domain-containing protein
LIFYRISNHDDLLGLGGELAVGRWHTKTKGKRIVYLSDHPALCVLEAIVQVDRESELPDTYQLLRVDVPENLLESLDEALLPDHWMSDQRRTRGIGDQWLSQKRKGGLILPSALVPIGRNCILNPLVPAVAAIQPAVLGRYPFDKRIR